MLAKSGVSASVESLTSLGYLESHEDTADRRKIHLKLTDSAAPVSYTHLDVYKRQQLAQSFGLHEQELLLLLLLFPHPQLQEPHPQLHPQFTLHLLLQQHI